MLIKCCLDQIAFYFSDLCSSCSPRLVEPHKLYNCPYSPIYTVEYHFSNPLDNLRLACIAGIFQGRTLNNKSSSPLGSLLTHSSPLMLPHTKGFFSASSKNTPALQANLRQKSFSLICFSQSNTISPLNFSLPIFFKPNVSKDAINCRSLTGQLITHGRFLWS